MNVVQKIFFMLFFFFGSNVSQRMTSWKKVQFSENNLDNNIPLGNEYLSSKLFCSLFCLFITDCKFWCIKSDEFCYFYDLVVSPAYETTEGNKIDCYTVKRNDIIFQASIVSIGNHKPIDVTENLIDGIKEEEKRYCTSYNTKSWILIDLKKSAMIYDLIIHPTLHSNWGPHYCQYFEVRISSTAPVTPGSFSSWEMFYDFDRECVAGGIEHLKPQNPKIGQYMSIQRKTYGAICFLHLEIDGVFEN